MKCVIGSMYVSSLQLDIGVSLCVSIDTATYRLNADVLWYLYTFDYSVEILSCVGLRAMFCYFILVHSL